VSLEAVTSIKSPPSSSSSVHLIVDNEDTGLIKGSPLLILQASVIGEDDQTEVDIHDPEMFTIRQIDESGACHTVVLSRAMCAEVAKLLDSYIYLPSAAPPPTQVKWSDPLAPKFNA